MEEVGDRTQGFRRMAARNKPAGIRVLVYGRDKGKAVIEGLSVSSRVGPGLILLLCRANTPYMRLSVSAFLAASLRSLTASAW